MEQLPKEPPEDANLRLAYEGLKYSVKQGKIEEQLALEVFNHWYTDFPIDNFKTPSDKLP